MSLWAQARAMGTVTVLQDHGEGPRATSQLGTLSPTSRSPGSVSSTDPVSGSHGLSVAPGSTAHTTAAPSGPRPEVSHAFFPWPLPSLTSLMKPKVPGLEFLALPYGHTSYLLSLSLNRGGQALLDPVVNQDMLPQENVIISDAAWVQHGRLTCSLTPTLLHRAPNGPAPLQPSLR